MSRNRRPTADNVASQMIITNGHERQAGDDVACVAQGVEESDLGWHRVGRVRTTKGLRMDLVHLVRVRGLVPSNQHRWIVTLARLGTRVQVVHASSHGQLDRQAQSLLRVGHSRSVSCRLRVPNTAAWPRVAWRIHLLAFWPWVSRSGRRSSPLEPRSRQCLRVLRPRRPLPRRSPRCSKPASTRRPSLGTSSEKGEPAMGAGVLAAQR